MPNLALGLSFKSPQWFEDFTWNSQYGDGTPARFSFNLDYPMIVGGGLSYEPIQGLTLASDVRWINYSKTDGFEQKDFDEQGRVRGFGWEDIWAVGVGGQYKSGPLALRAGYNYSENPIPADQQFFNVFAPAVVQHHATLGFGYDMTRNIVLNGAYYHAFKNQETGRVASNGGPGMPPANTRIDGTSVTNELSEDSLSLQLQFKF